MMVSSRIALKLEANFIRLLMEDIISPPYPSTLDGPFSDLVDIVAHLLVVRLKSFRRSIAAMKGYDHKRRWMHTKMIEKVECIIAYLQQHNDGNVGNRTAIIRTVRSSIHRIGRVAYPRADHPVCITPPSDAVRTHRFVPMRRRHSLAPRRPEWDGSRHADSSSDDDSAMPVSSDDDGKELKWNGCPMSGLCHCSRKRARHINSRSDRDRSQLSSPWFDTPTTTVPSSSTVAAAAVASAPANPDDQAMSDAPTIHINNSSSQTSRPSPTAEERYIVSHLRPRITAAITTATAALEHEMIVIDSLLHSDSVIDIDPSIIGRIRARVLNRRIQSLTSAPTLFAFDEKRRYQLAKMIVKMGELLAMVRNGLGSYNVDDRDCPLIIRTVMHRMRRVMSPAENRRRLDEPAAPGAWRSTPNLYHWRPNLESSNEDEDEGDEEARKLMPESDTNLSDDELELARLCCERNKRVYRMERMRTRMVVMVDGSRSPTEDVGEGEEGEAPQCAIKLKEYRNRSSHLYRHSVRG